MINELLNKNKTIIMGILNVTPDSFSDGGEFYEYKTALKHADEMIKDGADIIDIGGESTRPGAELVKLEEEKNRIIPIIKELSKKDVLISVDTYKSEVAKAAILAGAHIINDVSMCLYDKELAKVVSEHDVPIILMHNRIEPGETPHAKKVVKPYDDIVRDVVNELNESIKLLKSYDVKDENILVDPGIGFAKTVEDNLELLRRIKEFKELIKYPVVLGTSRKSFIGKSLNLEANERLEPTLFSNIFGVLAGCEIIRVHDVYEHYKAMALHDVMLRNKE